MIWIKSSVISLAITILIVFFLELSIRIFSDVKFFGHNKELFQYKNKDVVGNAKNNVAISFGQKVYINKLGHRVSEKNFYGDLKRYDKTYLFLGDSIAFGPGVNYEETFSGILEKANNNIKFINTGVIGYDVKDYERVIDEALVSELITKNDDVILLYSLNDISSLSAQNIKNKGNLSVQTIRNEDYVIKLKRIKIIDYANKLLREKSKLYLMLKGLITNPSKRYFLHELRLYESLGQKGISSKLMPIKRIKEKLEIRDIRFKVIIIPFSYQLQSLDKSILLPQRFVSQFLKDNKIKFIDATKYLSTKHLNKSDLYIKFDPAHFSELGHIEMYKLIQNLID